MNRRRLGPQLGIYLLLAIGVGLVWGLVAAFSTAMWQRHLSAASRQTLYENFVVSDEGNPLIGGYSYAHGAYQRLPYRTLAREVAPVEADEVAELRPATFPNEPRPAQWYDPPIDWSQRLAWASDEEPPLPGDVVRDPRRQRSRTFLSRWVR